MSGSPDAAVRSAEQRILIRAVDELHDIARMISYVANGLLIEDEQWADLRAWN